jgi:O-antigen/teichoic acid export membrane protein
MNTSATEKRFASSALVVLVARFIACVSAFGFTALLAQQLAPGEFGAFVLLFSLAGLATLVGSLGLNRAVVKRIAEAEGNVATQQVILQRSLRVGSVGGLVVAVVAGILLALSGTRIGVVSELVPWLFGGIVFLRTLHLVLAESSRGFHEKAWSNMFGSPAGGPAPHLLFLIALAVFVSTSKVTLESALTIYLLSFLVTLPILAWRVLTIAAGRLAVVGSDTLQPVRTEPLSALMVLSLPLMLTQVGSLAMSQADIWLAGGLVSVEELAIYGAAQRLLAFLTIPLQIAGTAIVSYIPQLHAQADREGLRSMVSLSASAAGAPGVVLGLLFLLCPRFVLGTIFGDFYQAGALVLVILATGQIVCILTGPCEMLLMMVGHHRKVLVVNTTATLVLFLAAPLSTRFWGVTGLALSMATVTATQNLVNCYLAYRCVGVNTAFSIQPLATLFETLRSRRGAEVSS